MPREVKRSVFRTFGPSMSADRMALELCRAKVDYNTNVRPQLKGNTSPLMVAVNQGLIELFYCHEEQDMQYIPRLKADIKDAEAFARTFGADCADKQFWVNYAEQCKAELADLIGEKS